MPVSRGSRTATLQDWEAITRDAADGPSKGPRQVSEPVSVHKHMSMEVQLLVHPLKGRHRGVSHLRAPAKRAISRPGDPRQLGPLLLARDAPFELRQVRRICRLLQLFVVLVLDTTPVRLLALFYCPDRRPFSYSLSNCLGLFSLHLPLPHLPLNHRHHHEHNRGGNGDGGRLAPRLASRLQHLHGIGSGLRRLLRLPRAHSQLGSDSRDER
eukprot:scaffold7893_cov220-Pinguiococcus_pyrenoidosus.AAC.2